MVEIIGIEPNHIKIAPVVFAMALKTVLRLYATIGMQTPILIEEGLYFVMAIQAFGVRHLSPKLVAQGTIAHAFQLTVCLGKVSR